MVDSISGCGAAPPGRPALQPVGSRDAAAPAGSVGGTASSAPVSSRAVEAGASAVSQLRDLGASPPVDAARVADLKARIADGSYQLDPDATAAAMIRSELGSSAA
jgi:negative regulator of flagellin synthesis FlgM